MRVQLFSGGLASLCVWLLCGRPTPVYVRLGGPREVAEVETLTALRERLLGFRPVLVDGPPLGDRFGDEFGDLPQRGLVLAVTAAAYLDPAEILLGTTLGQPTAGTSARYRRLAGRALTLSEGTPVRVRAPAGRWTRTGLLRRALAVDPTLPDVAALTRSCYLPVGPVCGACPGCFRRQVAEFHCGLRVARPHRSAERDLYRRRDRYPQRWPGLVVDAAVTAAAQCGLRLGSAPPPVARIAERRRPPPVMVYVSRVAR